MFNFCLRYFWILLTSALLCASDSQADEPTPADLEHFEKKIRPLLIKYCHECHGSSGKVEGNLRLDGEANWLKGGDTGPAIVPGKPDESEFIKAIRYGGDIEMPPTGKLPLEVIKTFEEWITKGAPAPKGEGAEIFRRIIDIEKGREFWSYRAVTNPPLPMVKGDRWPGNTIDHFILAKLESAKLQPSAEASREVLVRRLYFDLWGLPPTPEQIDAFVKDPTPIAYEKLVDQLLDSKHFGERFGRHWLDVARFGESLTLRGFVLPNAWRYRDYVIDSFYRDLPYDRFIREQIAGDLLLPEVNELDIVKRRKQAIAVTFLTLGNNNLEEQDKKQLEMDVVDEQLDVIGKAILAQTITCARCHDHKFDPIPTRDYYALAGILRNSKMLEHENVSKWIETRLPLTTAEEITLQKNKEILVQGERRLAALKREIGELKADLGLKVDPKQVAAASDFPGIVVDEAEAKKVGEWVHSTSVKPFIGSGYLHDNDALKGEKTLTFTPKLPSDGKYEVRLAYTPGENRAAMVPITIFSADGEKNVTVDMKSPPSIEGRFVSLGEYRFEAAGQSFVIVSTENTRGHVIADAVQFLPTGTKPERPANLAFASEGSDAAAEFASKQERLASALQSLEKLPKLLQVWKDELDALPKGMTLQESREITDCPVHLRGSVHTLGEVVPRGFLQVATSTAAARLPSNQSGRKELADWLSSSQNPLTARVYVNRVWHWLFGAGLVRSVDNFGSTGELPSHPELLDHLAAHFMSDGWSTKKLVRKIVLSQTYRQSSQERSDAFEVDPENRLIWRVNRKRLEAECLRDAMLQISGGLLEGGSGPNYPSGLAADYGYAKESLLRSVYLPVFRNALPAIYEPFDFADPSMVVGARNSSTTAPQALYLLNATLPHDCAKGAATKLHGFSSDDKICIENAFRLCLGRLPSPSELGAIIDSWDQNTGMKEEKLARVVHMLFCSLDFRYRD